MASKYLIYLLFLFFHSADASQYIADGNTTLGFSIELIHRFSPLSPFYDPAATPYSRMAEAARFSILRHESHRSSVNPNSIVAPVHPHTESHLMKLSIGTPPVELLAIVDTGSDIVWYRCNPCNDCDGRPNVDPHKSSTYENVACSSPQCRGFGIHKCSIGDCTYSVYYADGTYSKGALAAETLTIGSTNGRAISFPGFVFGCSHDNPGLDAPTAGVIGLNSFPLSLVSQLEPEVQGKFSYCLVPFEEESATSVMNFGDQAVIEGDGVISTPIATGSAYLAMLRAVSVGSNGRRIKLRPPLLPSGNFIIDSGSMLVYLETRVFNEMTDDITSAVNLPRFLDPANIFQTCYQAASRDDFPTITFHFEGGADVVLHPKNTITTGPDHGVRCLAMLPSDEPLGIFGDMAQQNFHVAYDVVAKTVSFKPTDCSKLSH